MDCDLSTDQIDDFSKQNALRAFYSHLSSTSMLVVAKVLSQWGVIFDTALSSRACGDCTPVNGTRCFRGYLYAIIANSKIMFPHMLSISVMVSQQPVE